MNQHNPWQSPEDSPTPQGHQTQQPYGAQYAPPPSMTQQPGSQYGAPQYGAPQYGSQYAPPPGQQQYQQGWTAPIKPGLIPLRPLTIGNMIGASFQVMRRNPRTTFGTALLVEGVVMLLAIGLMSLSLWGLFNSIDFVTFDINDPQLFGSIGLMVLSGLVPSLLSVFATVLLQGVLVLAISRETLGEKVNLRGLLVLAKGRIGTLLLWASLLLLAVLAILLLFFLGALPAVLWGINGAALTGFLMVVLVLALIVLGVWIGTKLSLVPAAIVLEKLSLRAAVKRSWSLTDKFFWRAFGVQALVAIILSLVSQVVSAPLSIIAGIVLGLAAPVGGADIESFIWMTVIIYVVIFLVTLLITAVTLVAQTAASSLVYIDLRMRKEGLDLELVRFVENKQTGVQPNPDPYLAAPNLSANYRRYSGAQAGPAPGFGQQPYSQSYQQTYQQPYQQPYGQQYQQPYGYPTPPTPPAPPQSDGQQWQRPPQNPNSNGGN